MREIKFRAWNDNKMFYYENNVYIPELFYGISDGQISKENIMQHIGLKDKNDKEIYEGDIVRFNQPIPTENNYGSDKVIYIVKWSYDITGFYPFNDYDSDCNIYIDDKDRYEYEVIGNKFENPELIKENK